MKIKLFTVPNLLTLSNLMCGTFASLAALVYGSLEWAFWFIVLAAVFDFFDFDAEFPHHIHHYFNIFNFRNHCIPRLRPAVELTIGHIRSS